MSSVSILHAPRDEVLSEKIAAALARAGIAAAPKQTAQEEGVALAPAALAEDAAIVVWTEAAAKLVRLHDQAREAMARGALVPVAVGGAQPPGGFESLPPIDLSGWSGALDDPRWRFVLEEIQIAQQRLQLEDGAFWATPLPNLKEKPVELGSLDAPDVERRKPHRRAARRRFKSRDVAIGATAGFACMAVGTALLAPVLLGGDDPAVERVAGQVDTTSSPSLETPMQLSSLTIASDVDGAVVSHDLDHASPDMTVSATSGAESGDALSGQSVLMDEADASITDNAHLFEDDIETSSLVDEDASGAAAEDDVTTLTHPEEYVHNPADRELDMIVAAALAESEAAGAYQAATEPVPAAMKETAYLGNYFRECVDCPDMAELPPGSFSMGAPSDEPGQQEFEGPARVVTIDHSFAIGTREVTFDQWSACVEDGGCRAYAPSDHGWGRDERPVVNVSYADAQAFTAWLSDKTGHNYRLPTEAEWEYAARAGVDAPFAFGGAISTEQANFNGNYPYRNEKGAFRTQTTPVASFQPNAFGLFDMHGNAWEWTSDCWSDSHNNAASDGSARIGGDCSRRVLKGGAWNTGAWRLRSAHRIGKPVNIREYDNGFRVVRDLD